MEKGLPESLGPTRETCCSRRTSLRRRITRGVLFTSLTLGALYQFAPAEISTGFSSTGIHFPWDRPPRCPAPRANLFAYHPPRPSDDTISKAFDGLDKWLEKEVSDDEDIDNIAVAIVTPAGPIFQKGYGVLKANETCSEDGDPRPPVADSIYRIASITKMFTVLETLILRERGVLNWDDPIDKYLPDFAPPSYGWASYLKGGAKTAQQERITLRQAASHIAGIGRDYPPIHIKEWPGTISGNDTEDRTRSQMMKSVAEYPLANVPWQYPIYSNIGINLLGLSNVEANKKASSNPDQEPQTHKELVKRDIFDPLGLTSSFFAVPADQSIRDRVAIPKNNSESADYVMNEADDPCGGQFSSLGDLAKVMQTFLSPVGRGGVIPASVVREWLRPLYVWGATGQQVGAPWEIGEFENAQYFSKGGAFPGYYSEFAIFPEFSYGVIALMNGRVSKSLDIIAAAAKHIQPAIRKVYTAELEKRYTGTWVNGDDVAEIFLDKKGKHDETLMIKKLVIGGVDILKTIQDISALVDNPQPVALWSTGRVGEFRLAFGRTRLNKDPKVGCFPYWATIDPGVFSRGAPLDLLYWDRGALTYPSSGVTFNRK